MEEIKIVPVVDKPGAFKTEDGKQFVSQELTDRLIQQRLAEEKTKWEASKNEAVTAEASKREAAETALNEAKSQIKTLEAANVTAADSDKVLADTFEAITLGMSDTAKRLIPDYGTTADKIKFINKNPEVFFPKAGASPLPIPQAPAAPAPGATIQNGELPSLSEILKPGGAQAALAKLDSRAAPQK